MIIVIASLVLSIVALGLIIDLNYKVSVWIMCVREQQEISLNLFNMFISLLFVDGFVRTEEQRERK